MKGRSVSVQFALYFNHFTVVTGATEGVGKAFAEELARRGMNIVLVDGDLEKLNEVSAEIGTL